MKRPGLLFLILFSALASYSQHEKPAYQWPKDPDVLRKLDDWQDRKFGLILHWGLYAVPGIIESWALCSEPWIERDSTVSYEDFKKRYWGYSAQFNPTKFDPENWAKAGKAGGMRYLVFTTKHHDGFCLFDTRQTDFKISAGPFKSDPRADVTRFIFDAFRKEGFMVGAYFSKPDWHSEYYWWPKYATADRNNNYDIRKYPWRWNRFKQFTYEQVSELMHNYGKVDLLWLDGGWVRPLETVNDEVRSWGAAIPAWSQDIDMPRIAAMARSAQPGLLIVDRTVHGEYENYETPEQRIPDKQLNHPWESCMTLGGAWGYVAGDRYKSAAKVIHTLAEVSAKGGSLLLGIGPRPDGTLPENAVARMAEIGTWLDINGAAIYGTRSTPDYHDGDTWFTRSKQGDTGYAIYCVKEGAATPASLRWTGNLPRKGTKLILLQTGKPISWKAEGNTLVATLPEAMVGRKDVPALALAFTPAEKL